MKARILRQKQALLWGVTPHDQRAASTLLICQRLGITCRLPGIEGWGKKVETLLQTPDTQGCAWEEEPLLLLSGLTDGELEELLGQLRQAKLVWPYKAMVTPHNRNWTLEQLYREIQREHQAVRRQMEST